MLSIIRLIAWLETVAVARGAALVRSSSGLSWTSVSPAQNHKLGQAPLSLWVKTPTAAGSVGGEHSLVSGPRYSWDVPQARALADT